MAVVCFTRSTPPPRNCLSVRHVGAIYENVLQSVRTYYRGLELHLEVCFSCFVALLVKFYFFVYVFHVLLWGVHDGHILVFYTVARLPSFA